MRIAMVSEHASPLAALGGVDAGGQNVHVASLAGKAVGKRHRAPPPRALLLGSAVVPIPGGAPRCEDRSIDKPPHDSPIIVGVDGSERSIDALALADMLAPSPANWLMNGASGLPITLERCLFSITTTTT